MSRTSYVRGDAEDTLKAKRCVCSTPGRAFGGGTPHRAAREFVYHLSQTLDSRLSRPVQDPECHSSADLREIQALATSSKALKLRCDKRI